MNLLTGSTGLIGAHLLAQLIIRKESTRALFRSEAKKQQAISVVLKYDVTKEDINRFVKWQKCDILDIPSLEIAFDNITHVYHCAGFISNSPSDYKMMRKVNIEGTANMVNLAIHFNIEKFCHVSSIATLGKPIDDNELATEHTPMAEDQKSSAYEISKYGAEMEVWRGSQEGIDVVIVNPGIIFGDGFYETGSGKFLSQIIKGIKFYPSKISGFVGVYDLSEIMIRLMKSSVINERFIVVSENLSFKKVMGTLAELHHQPSPHIKLKPWMLYIAWGLEWLKSLFSSYKRQLTLEIIPGLFHNSLYSSEKIQKELNYEFEALEVYAKRIRQRS